MKNQSKSMSRRGLGRSWSDLGGPGEVAGCIWAKNLEKRKKNKNNKTFLVLFGQLLEPWGAQVGPKRPSWACLGRLGVDDGKRSMALAIGDWSCWALANRGSGGTSKYTQLAEPIWGGSNNHFPLKLAAKILQKICWDFHDFKTVFSNFGKPFEGQVGSKIY